MSAAPIALIFDLDGTLIDSAPTIMAVGNLLLAERGLAPLSLPEAKGYIGNGAKVFIQKALAARGALEGVDLDAAHDRMEALYDGVDFSASTPFPGMKEALSGFADRGHPLGICTNRPAGPARLELAAHGLADLFSVVVGGDTLAVRKPDPAPLRAAAEQLGGAAYAFIGDSDVDAATAEAAGAAFLLFTEGYRHAPVEALPHRAAFGDYADLPGIVVALSSGASV